MENDKILVNYYNIDGIDYLVLNEIDYNGKHYVYLSNEKDDDDFMIRWVNGEILEPLDSEDELNGVLKLLVK